MADQDFPVPVLWPYVAPVWPKANATGMRAAHGKYGAARPRAKDGLALAGGGYGVLANGYWADPSKPQSDAYDAVAERHEGFAKDAADFDRIADANEQVMAAAPDNTDHAKDQISALAHVAATQIAMNQAVASSIYSSAALTQGMNQKVYDQLASGAKQKQQDYASKNQALPQVPEYEIRNKVDYNQGIGDTGIGIFQQANSLQKTSTNDLQQANSLQKTSTNDLQQANSLQKASTNDLQQTGGAQPGAAGSPGAQGGSGVAGVGKGSASVPGANSASTGLQSGAALAEHGASAAAPQAAPGSGAGGGVGAPSSIGGIGGGPAGGAGGPARIGGISGGGASGGGADAPRTGAQGAGAGDKPSGSGSSSSGSGDRQGSGLSRGGAGAGAGAAGGATQAQSAQQAALRDAVRTGDAAAGAARAGDHAAARSDILGTGRTTLLSPTALQSAHGETAKVKSAFSGLEGQLAASYPAADAGQLASWVVGGGTVTGARKAGFLADGVTWGWVPQPPFEHVGLSGLVFLFEDMRTSPNEEAGVFRSVSARVTTTGWLGEVDPAMRLPEGTRILDRSKAPAATDYVTDAGRLAAELARWLLEAGLDGDQSQRLVAVCFLEEPDQKWVHALATMSSQVESFWPDRPGYDLGDAGRKAVQDARVLSSEELAAKQADPLRHAADMARSEPDGMYDPTGLPPKEAEWYRKSAGRAQKPMITNARWKQEFDQYLREERGVSGANW